MIILVKTNETLTDTLQQLRQEDNRLFQALQRKEKYLHAAQQRIVELKQEVNSSRDVAGRMQNWEGRLAACEQHSKNPRNIVSDRRRIQTPVFKQKKQEAFLDLGGQIGQRAERPQFPKIGNPGNRRGNDQWSKSHRRRSVSLADEAELCARLKQIALSRSGEN
jgi:hypothetical protein